MTGQKILGSLSECCPYVIIRLVNIVVYNISFICQNCCIIATKFLSLSKNLFFLFFVEFLHITEFHFKKVRISILSFCLLLLFLQCVYFHVRVIDLYLSFFPEATNGTGLLDKSMQADCILSVDRIMEGLHEVPHSFSYWLWGELCNGVLFPLDKEVPWLVTFLMKAVQREMQNVCNVVFSIWQLFLLSFLPHWSLACFRKTYILAFSLF